MEVAKRDDLGVAADLAVRCLEWRKSFLDTPNFSEADYQFLAQKEAATYSGLFGTDKGYPSAFLVARAQEEAEPQTGGVSFWPFGNPGPTSRIVGCVALEVKCFKQVTGEEVPVIKYDGGRTMVLRPVVAGLAVEPQSRGRGIARKLLNKVDELVLSWGYQEVILLVEVTNFQARGLYERLGWRLNGLVLLPTTYLQTDGSYREIKQRPAVALILRRSLKPGLQGIIENTNWGPLAALLGTSLAVRQGLLQLPPPLAGVLESLPLPSF